VSRIVLYIDDNADNLRLVERLLQRHPGVTLRTAMTGQDGLAAAAGEPPALILLDNRLPDGNGLQVLRQLAAEPATAAVPVVILSGDTGGSTVEDLLAAGAAGFLPKPFDIADFVAVIERHLG
jgi:CheY-like chemotaxis protein